MTNLTTLLIYGDDDVTHGIVRNNGDAAVPLDGAGLALASGGLAWVDLGDGLVVEALADGRLEQVWPYAVHRRDTPATVGAGGGRLSGVEQEHNRRVVEFYESSPRR